MKKTAFSFFVFLCLLLTTCKKNTNTSNNGTCSDGILNQNETAIDCGGSCSKCPTCNDGIQNQGEKSIDCGGPCSPCAILYPDSGLIGLNILKKSYDTITVKANTWFSAFAVLGPQNSIKVRITNPQGLGLNWWFNLGLGKWILKNVDSNTQELKSANTSSYIDAEFGFQTTNNGMARFEIFENGALVPTRKIIVYWFS